jgi:hypothetical protein
LLKPPHAARSQQHAQQQGHNQQHFQEADHRLGLGRDKAWGGGGESGRP